MAAPVEPTAEQRRLVHALAGFGVPQEDIARHVGIDAKTLRKHFREELDRGTTDANAKVAQSLFRMATQGNNVAAAIFWMKARAGWREKQVVEHGLAPISVISGVPRADDLSDDELARIAARAYDDDGSARGRRGSYVLDGSASEMATDTWTARGVQRDEA